MLLPILIACLFGALAKSDAPVKAGTPIKVGTPFKISTTLKVKSSKTLLTPVRPLPCHSVTMIKEARPTEFLFIAPGNSGDCSFIFEGLEGGRLDIKVRNLKSNLPRGNGDPCEDGQVRLYNYKGSGQITLSQRLCDNEKEVTMLTDSNMAIVASSLIDGSFSVVARSVKKDDLLVGNDVDQFLTPPDTMNHDWTTKATTDLSGERKQENVEGNQVDDNETSDDTQDESQEEEKDDDRDEMDNESLALDSMNDIKEPSLVQTPPNDEPIQFLGNFTDMTNTNYTNSNCSYNSYGYYVCNITNSNHTGYYYEPSPTYFAPYHHYNPNPIYSPPYEHHSTYESLKPEYSAPIYSSPNPVYSPPNPIYSVPSPTYSSPTTIYKAPDNLFSTSGPVYNAPDHKYSNHFHDYNHEKPFVPSQPIPNNYWDNYNSHDNYYESPVWFDEKGPYPGKPTNHVDLTHDSYPTYPSYYNPGYYGNNNYSTTPPSLTSTKAPGKRTTLNRPKTTKQGQATTTTSQPTTIRTTTKHHHHFFDFAIPWTANVSITSGDNLETSLQEGEQNTTTSRPTHRIKPNRIKLNRIINNLPSA